MMNFKLMAFSPADAQKGNAAAKIGFYEYSALLDVKNMDQDELALCIKKYGAHPELVKAAEAFRSVAEPEVL